MQLFSAVTTMLIQFFFLPTKSWKKHPQKLLIISPNAAHSQKLRIDVSYHKMSGTSICSFIFPLQSWFRRPHVATSENENWWSFILLCFATNLLTVADDVKNVLKNNHSSFVVCITYKKNLSIRSWILWLLWCKTFYQIVFDKGTL